MTFWAAGRYDAVGDRIAGIAHEIVAAVARRATLRDAAVVDLACGTGNAALAAAEAGARVTGVDLTAELIAIATQKARAAGQSVTWVTSDAADTGLPDQAFDAAISNMGIIFVEPESQLAEVSRLLKPTGTLGFSSWVRPTENPLFDPVVSVLGPAPPADFTPDQWGDGEIVTDRLSPDYDDIEIERGVSRWEFASMSAALYFLRNESPIHVETFRRADEAQRERLAGAFEDALRPHVDESGGVGFTAPYVVVTARRR